MSIGYANICSSVQGPRQNFVYLKGWKNKREQKNQQKGSLKRLKWSAPEVQSAYEVMTSSEASSSEATSTEAEVHQERKNLKLQELEFF